MPNDYMYKAIFTSDPSISIPENVTFPVEATTQQIKLDILSSSALTSISVKTANTGQSTATTITTLSQYSIAWHYLIVFNGITLSLAGPYNITIKLSNGRTVSTLFNVIVSQSKFECAYRQR